MQYWAVLGIGIFTLLISIHKIKNAESSSDMFYGIFTTLGGVGMIVCGIVALILSY